MFFSLLTASAVMQSFAMRPDMRPEQSTSTTVSRLRETLRTSDQLTFLKEAATVVDTVLIQAGNATDHLQKEDKELLEQVIDMIRNTMYLSMDSSHDGDELALKNAIADIGLCSQALVDRRSPTGDIGTLRQSAIILQTELTRLQGIVGERRQNNVTVWGQFETHMMFMKDAPDCPVFPHQKDMGRFDVYFGDSNYSTWWTAVRRPYFDQRDAWKAADASLTRAIEAYLTHQVTLHVKYCDWKTELLAACARFEECIAIRSNYYSNILVPRVQGDMNSRVEVHKAGETLVAQVNFLLGKSDSSKTPEVDSSRFQLTFPPLPPRELCDMSPLTSVDWDPPIVCDIPEEMRGRWLDLKKGFYDGAVIVIEPESWHVEKPLHKYKGGTYYLKKVESGWDLLEERDGHKHHHYITLKGNGEMQVQKGVTDFEWTLARQPLYTYVGCHVDGQNPRNLPDIKMWDDATAKTCHGMCSNYKYFALQSKDCWCGNGTGTGHGLFEKRSDLECSGECVDPADGENRCGNTWRNSVYEVSHDW